MFGELIGLWCAVVWQGMGSPSPLRLVELGPGRGTLMRDALRAAERVPGFLDALRVHLVETASRCAQMQRETLPRRGRPPQADRLPIAWHDALARGAGWAGHRHRQRVPRRAADPAARVRRGRAGASVCVELDAAGALRFADRATGRLTLEQRQQPPARRHPRAAGRRGRGARRAGRARRALRRPLHRLRPGRARLSATRCRPCAGTPTSIRWPTPGAADLTAHVAVRRPRRQGTRERAWPPTVPSPRPSFWARLGIAERAARLMAANPSGPARSRPPRSASMSPAGMGQLFKVLAVRSPASSAAAPVRLGLAPMPKPVTADRLAAVGTPAGIAPRLLHPPRRRLAGHLCQPQLRARLQGRSGGGRARTARASPRYLGAHSLLTAHQVHSPTAVVVDRAWRRRRAAARRRHRHGHTRHRARRADGGLRAGAVRRPGGRRRRRRPRRLARRHRRRARGDHRGHGRAGRKAGAHRAAVGPCIGQPPTRWARSSSRSSRPRPDSAPFFTPGPIRGRGRISICPAMSCNACRARGTGSSGRSSPALMLGARISSAIGARGPRGA